MNALEKIEEQENKLNTIAERLYEIHEILQRILPIVDGIVSVVGRDAVLEAAQKLSESQREAHVSQLLNEFEQRKEAGEFTESEQVELQSVLFVNESKGDGPASLRLLPVESVNEAFRSKVVGAKKGDVLDFGVVPEGVKIVVERIFTPSVSPTE